MNYNFDEIINRENTNCIKWDLRESVFGRADVLPAWVADMDFRTPDFVMNAIREKAEHEIMGYVFRPQSFFDSVRDWLKRRNGWQTDSKDMVFTPGIVPALNFSVEVFTDKGDKVVIQPPVYTPFFGAIKDHERELIENPLVEKDGYYTIDFEDMERKLANNAKMFILCNPHNPVGRVWTKEELLQIGNLCVKHNVLIISDEIHCDLVFKPNKHIHIASLSDQIAQLTLTCLAPSKTFNMAGFATSIAHSANSEILKKFNSFIERYHLNMGNIFGNIAFEAAYKYGDDWLDQLLDYVKANMEYVEAFLKENMPEIRTRKNEGTYLMWLDFKAFNLKDSDLNDMLINKAGLGLNSGIMFGLEGKGFMRLNVACPRATLEKVMKQLLTIK
ncbi:MAG: PatB family C-S lyase [Prevotellaceae bacterium]|jgi:cystathionine beta-lyase|nr:PatB family C-S lyase [Prevotellaceae bacterium]